MMAWSSHDVASKLAGPAFAPIDFKVISVEQHRVARAGKNTSDAQWRVYIEFLDPFEHTTRQDYGITGADDAGKWLPGATYKGLYAPQWPRPILSQVAPNYQNEVNFTRTVATVLIPLGLLVLALAWKFGRLT